MHVHLKFRIFKIYLYLEVPLVIIVYIHHTVNQFRCYFTITRTNILVLSCNYFPDVLRLKFREQPNNIWEIPTVLAQMIAVCLWLSGSRVRSPARS